MNIIPFKAEYPKMDLIASPDSFFGTAKQEYTNYYKNGFFDQTELNAIYLYHIKTSVKTHRGFIANNDIRDFGSNKVLKHEKTLATKEQKMMSIMLQNEAMIKPILLAYDKVDELDKIFDKIQSDDAPFLEIPFSGENELHSLWKISDPQQINEIKNLFKSKVQKVYIADGHHRTSTTLKMYENKGFEERIDSILSVYFPFSELSIYDYNRVVDLNELIKETDFVVRLSFYFDIRPIKTGRKSQKKHEITMYLNHQWYRLRWRKKILKKYKDKRLVLDTALLNRYVFKKILKISDIRNNPRIIYVGGKDGLGPLMEESQKTQKRVAFNLYPVSEAELKFSADNNISLPPKSTWFEPRIKNGMIVNKF